MLPQNAGSNILFNRLAGRVMKNSRLPGKVRPTSWGMKWLTPLRKATGFTSQLVDSCRRKLTSSDRSRPGLARTSELHGMNPLPSYANSQRIFCYLKADSSAKCIVREETNWHRNGPNRAYEKGYVRTLFEVVFFQMPDFRKTLVLIGLALAVVVPVLSAQSSYAQFVPCKIVNLNPVPPTSIEAGQPFQLTTNLIVSCDPSVLPVVRVDLLDAQTAKVLSTASRPYYTPSSSFTISVVDQADARQLPGSWALEVQAYVINGITGQAVASASQLFQVNVDPYQTPVAEMKTTESTAWTSSNSAISTQVLPTATTQEVVTEALPSTQTTFSAPASGTVTTEWLVPGLTVLVGLTIFLVLAFARHRREQRSGISYCSQCGSELGCNQKYCTSCGTRQTN